LAGLHDFRYHDVLSVTETEKESASGQIVPSSSKSHAVQGKRDRRLDKSESPSQSEIHDGGSDEYISGSTHSRNTHSGDISSGNTHSGDLNSGSSPTGNAQSGNALSGNIRSSSGLSSHGSAYGGDVDSNRTSLHTDSTISMGMTQTVAHSAISMGTTQTVAHSNGNNGQGSNLEGLVAAGARALAGEGDTAVHNSSHSDVHRQRSLQNAQVDARIDADSRACEPHTHTETSDEMLRLPHALIQDRSSVCDSSLIARVASAERASIHGADSSVYTHNAEVNQGSRGDGHRECMTKTMSEQNSDERDHKVKIRGNSAKPDYVRETKAKHVSTRVADVDVRREAIRVLIAKARHGHRRVVHCLIECLCLEWDVAMRRYVQCECE
jgi:hypothetical protein